ncbi:MAG TPA: UDP-N-acetylmuramoyl-L-alanine--D-glutamate ligase [Kiritimatiellia bacterium]|nr:UDP-N-acetylmuramoyl-L-alanine--D-glutamate ligase [Kiritimatiellia bacterium]
MHTGTHALVLGLGESGAHAAKLLLREGLRVTIFEQQVHPMTAEAWVGLGGQTVAAAPDAAIPADVDLCVVSPGIPVEHPWLASARARGLHPVPEFELGWSRFRGRVAAITGTNGKSTMVKWMAESLLASGFRAAPAGNYGPSVSRVVCEQPDLDWLVIEASSFQLETARHFRADLSVLLNIAPNHLDRHPSMEAYVDAKARLFAQVRGRDVCMAPAAWRTRMQAASGGRGAWYSFGCAATDDYRWGNSCVLHRADTVLDARGTFLDNAILGPHAAAVAGALHAAGLPLDGAGAAARAFKSLPHRMEPVAEAGGIRFVNDSKATTLTAMRAALEMAGGPVRLIAGGLLKETDLNCVKEMLALHARGVYLVGKAAEKMASQWADTVPCEVCGELEKAVGAAWRAARPGEVILLSPGCASFDQFANFERRGDEFRRIAKALAGERKS